MVYGFTVIKSAGFTDGSESKTHLYNSKEKRDNEAYYEYCYRFADYGFEDGEDADGTEMMDKGSFLNYIHGADYPYISIQGKYSHIQIELYDFEIN